MDTKDLLAKLESNVLDEWRHFKRNRKEKIEFNNIRLSGKEFHSKDLSGVSFVNTQLVGSKFINCNFKNANLEHADLRAVEFTGSDLRGVKIEEADFTSCILKNVHINAVDLERFKTDQITKFQKRQMIVHYGLGKLKQSYSGISGVIHIFSTLSFLLPYLIFVISAMIQSYQLKGVAGTKLKSLWQLLSEKILENGEIYLIPFFILAFFHITRIFIGILVMKLEQEEKIKGVVSDLQIVSLREIYSGKFPKRDKVISTMYYFSKFVSFFAAIAMVWHWKTLFFAENIIVFG